MKRQALLALAVVAFGACQEDAGGPTPDQAQVRLLHASPGVGTVDLVIGNTAVVQNLAFGKASTIATVNAGAQEVLVRSGTQEIGRFMANLSADHLNSVIVASGAVSMSAEVHDTGAVNPTRANVRLVNIVGTSSADPTLLDARLQATNQAGQAPDSVQVFQMDAKVASYSSLMYLNPGEVTVSFVPRGGSTVLAQVKFAATTGTKKAVTLERSADGTYHAQVVDEP